MTVEDKIINHLLDIIEYITEKEDCCYNCDICTKIENRHEYKIIAWCAKENRKECINLLKKVYDERLEEEFNV